MSKNNKSLNESRMKLYERVGLKTVIVRKAGATILPTNKPYKKDK